MSSLEAFFEFVPFIIIILFFLFSMGQKEKEKTGDAYEKWVPKREDDRFRRMDTLSSQSPSRSFKPETKSDSSAEKKHRPALHGIEPLKKAQNKTQSSKQDSLSISEILKDPKEFKTAFLVAELLSPPLTSRGESLLDKR